MLIKICCIQSVDEMSMAAAAGATHVGLVGAMPSGPGSLPDARIADLVGEAPFDVVPVLLTAEDRADAIVAHVRRVAAPAVQIVSHVPPSVRLELRRALPGVRIVQVVHVEGPDSVGHALEAGQGADLVLLDSGRPSAETPELGGTGRVHDWSVSAEIVKRLDAPVLLAGGLAPSNVGQAVESVRPAGVDVCSGLRGDEGRLDVDVLSDFVARVRG